MEGNLSHINLNDVLLLATAGKKSGVLKLSRGNESVDVYLSEGDIVHATCPMRSRFEKSMVQEISNFKKN